MAASCASVVANLSDKTYHCI